MPSKPDLRKTLLAQRLHLTTGDWQQKSREICAHLRTSPVFINATTVLAYFSIRQEPDLSSLFSDHKTWGFPRCVDKNLSWHSWSVGDPLIQSSYNIPEPRSDAPFIQPEQVDLILVPAIACDRRGYRLGYGGGFYDRLFSDPGWATKPAIGLVFAFAYLPQLPIDEWDRPLAGVCTEAGFYLNKI